MEHGAKILFAIFVAFVAAQIGKEIAQRLRMPGVVGEIAAGVAIGPFALNWLPKTELPTLQIFAELGAVFLLFAVGLETRLGDLQKVGKESSKVGVFGVVLPFVVAFALAKALNFPVNKALFFGAAFVATSAGITARVLQEFGVLSRKSSQVILGAAVIDDILAMLLLGVVSSLGKGGFDPVSIGFLLAQAVGFVIVVGIVGGRIMRRSSKLMDLPLNPNSALALSLMICLGLAFLSAQIGLAAIIGAFLAGMLVAETEQRHSVEKQVISINELIVPFFFVVTGSQVDIRQLANVQMIGFVLLVTVLAGITKFVAGYFGSSTLGKGEARVVGIGMIPRGEVGIIVAALGLQSGAFDEGMYSVIIAMSLLTAIVAPPLLQIALKASDKMALSTTADLGLGISKVNGSDDQT